ncbi:MAG: lycopene cyclase domain-containing protein [Bacteroidota bacterium]|nr:lycopene cyclase domain-containing protein [Bacteroidota bacterium]MDP4225429.1 lycopene cyclase domain-containing protein [Bacteroidota bacterium]MDP4273480.1 lycopene cyclase domain-containing protein [Bacteroidota bacterium]
MWLYSLILLCSIIVPLALSFEKKLQFHKQWKYLFPAIILVSCIFISFDVYFTKIGVWGFNPAYHLNIVYLGLPIEEWLFFIIIPYASIFLHDSIVLHFPKISLPNRVAFFLGLTITISLAVLAVLYHKKAYTVYIFITGFVAVVFSFFDKSKLINHYYITFLIILVPFIVANAILTGSFIENEVVWYNKNENLGIRVFTIPIEDFIYGFSLILLVLLLREKIKKHLLFNDK